MALRATSENCDLLALIEGKRRSSTPLVRMTLNVFEDLPEINTNAVDVTTSQEVSCWRESDAGRDAGGPEGVDEATGRDVESSDDGVEGGGDEPSRIGRESLRWERNARKLLENASGRKEGTKKTHNIENATLESSHLTNDPLCLNVDDSNDEIVTDDGEESIISMKGNGGDRGRKSEGLKSDSGVEVEELARKTEQFVSQPQGLPKKQYVRNSTKESTYSQSTVHRSNNNDPVQRIRHNSRHTPSSDPRRPSLSRRNHERLPLQTTLHVPHRNLAFRPSNQSEVPTSRHTNSLDASSAVSSSESPLPELLVLP